MNTIAGAVLINAACILMASGRDTFEVYGLQRILIAFGAGLIAVDLQNQLRTFFKKAKAERV